MKIYCNLDNKNPPPIKRIVRMSDRFCPEPSKGHWGSSSQRFSVPDDDDIDDDDDDY